MTTSKRRALRGTLCVIAGGCAWGFSGVCGQYFFAHSQASSLWLTSVRVLSGGILLFLTALAKRPRDMAAIWRKPGDALRVVLYGLIGLLLAQYSYLTCISYSNAATATVLQTLNLVFIMLITCLRKRRKPTFVESLALVLALFGTFMLSTGGDFRQMSLSPLALFWGLVLAGCVVVSNLLPQSLLEQWDRSVILGWGMLIGGVAINLVGRSWTLEVQVPLEGWLAVGGVLLFGTLLPFSLFM